MLPNSVLQLEKKRKTSCWTIIKNIREEKLLRSYDTWSLRFFFHLSVCLPPSLRAHPHPCLLKKKQVEIVWVGVSWARTLGKHRWSLTISHSWLFMLTKTHLAASDRNSVQTDISKPRFSWVMKSNCPESECEWMKEFKCFRNISSSGSWF